MFLDPPIEKLPFFLQKKILDYRPKFQKIINYNILKKHFNRKYCKICGEYIDKSGLIDKLDDNLFLVKHLHLKNQKYFKYDNKDIYYITNANCIHIFFIYKNVMSFSDYLIYKQIRFNFKIIYKKKHLKYFFNFKNILLNKNHKLDLKINLIDINVFKNTNLYIEKDFFKLFPYFNMNDYKHNRYIYMNKISMSYSLIHQIYRLLELNISLYKYFFPIFLLNDFLNILLFHCQEQNYIMNYDKIPLYFYIFLIEKNYMFFEYIDNELLNLLSKKFPNHLIKLLKKDINYSFYIEICHL